MSDQQKTSSSQSQSEQKPENNGKISEEALNLAKRLKEAYTREFVFLLVGRTGVGKSSTINQLMGEEVAKVGDFEPMTMSVEQYKLPIDNINFVVFDTPGLCDDIPEKGNDKGYIKKIKDKIKYVDCVLYVTPLSDTRIRSDERYGLELITKAFGEKIWMNSLLVFTFADQVKPEKYTYSLETRSRLIREVIQRDVSSEITSNIPSVAIDNTSNVTPDGKPWLGELYTTVVERVSADGFLQYLMATAPEIIEKEAPPKIIERVVEKPIYIETPVYVYSSGGGSNSTSGSKQTNKASDNLTDEQIKRITSTTTGRGVPTNPNIWKQAEDFVKETAKKTWNMAKSGFNAAKRFFGF